MKELSLKLKIWRQKNQDDEGRFIEYDIDKLNEHMSFLEMLDVLNERLISKGEEPIAFDHDCREGICGSCSMVINGKPHGPLKGTTSCQLHMYHFNNGDSITKSAPGISLQPGRIYLQTRVAHGLQANDTISIADYS